MGTTLKFIFSDEAAAKAFVRAVTLQYEAPTLRVHHVAYVISLDEQYERIYNMAHAFGGWDDR